MFPASAKTDAERLLLKRIAYPPDTAKMRGVGLVDGQVVAEANMMARVVDR